MKSSLPADAQQEIRRAPQGARGLKLRIVKNKEGLLLVAPRKGRVG